MGMGMGVMALGVNNFRITLLVFIIPCACGAAMGVADLALGVNNFPITLLVFIFFACKTVGHWVAHPLKSRQLAVGRVVVAVFFGLLVVAFFARYRWLNAYGSPTWPQPFPYPDGCLVMLDTSLNSLLPADAGALRPRFDLLAILHCLDGVIVLLTACCGAAYGVVRDCSHGTRTQVIETCQEEDDSAGPATPP